MSEQMSLVKRISEYAVNLRYEDIPAEALRLAQWLVFDTIGTALGGYQRPLGQKAVSFGTTMMKGDEANLIGDGSRVSEEGAAFTNAVMAKILGMDDSHRSAGHIAAEMVPAILAIGQTHGTSGKELLTAIVAAYDVTIRLGLLVRHTHRERGHDLKGTVGAIGATIAAGRCAGLSFEQMCQAVALSTDMASGTEQYVYEGGKCETKDLIAGFAARTAVFAVRLAESGFYGPDGAFDGAYGFFRAFGSGAGDPAAFDDLGQNFMIVSTGFKPHGGCRHTHQAVDAVQQMLAQSPLDASDIEAVTLHTYGYATRPIFRVDPNPKSRDVAGLSIRVATAIALTHGSANPDDYADWDAPLVRHLRNLIDVQIEPEIEANYPNLNGCRLEVTLKSGETRTAALPNMKGEPEFPMTVDDLKNKFHGLTHRLFDRDRVDLLYQRCIDLASLSDVNELLELTRPVERIAEPA